jgi:hypothetical protein
MRGREPYVTELAQTVATLFVEGNTDPSADEIAAKHFEGKALGGEIIEGIRKRLRRVRDVVEQDFELPVYLLNHTYYARFRKDPPATDADARRCIPGGFHVVAAGIRLNEGEGDLIYQAHLSQNLVSGAGKLKKNLDRTLDAAEDGRLSNPQAATVMDRGRRRAEPEKLALATEVMKELPEAKS